jgi:hypothetical protein
MERPEVPLEQAQESIAHHARAAEEKWIMGVALTAAMLAVLAAITALFAEYDANEAVILQIEGSNQWAYYQSKGIKGNLLATRMEVLTALGKPVTDQDRKKAEQYREEQDEIRKVAEEKHAEATGHLARHHVLAYSLTMFQIGIAVAAIAVLTKRKSFWLASMGLGIAGVTEILWGLLG